MTPPQSQSLAENQNAVTGPHQSGGKAARARHARMGIAVVGSRDNHRPSGGAPVASSLDPTTSAHYEVIVALEDAEKRARIKFRPAMETRMEVPMDNHGSMEPPRLQNTNTNPALRGIGECSMAELSLRSFSLDLIILSDLNCHPSFSSITTLDLSRNELWTLPELSSLPNVTTLNLSRNWFQDLPASLSDLSLLTTLRASHNMLRSSRSSLQLESGVLQSLSHLRELDLTFNQKCGHQKLFDRIQQELPQLLATNNNGNLKMTISFPRPEGAFVGASASDRDATLLRSQIEPWSTTALRRRYVADFGGDVTSPEEVPRGDLMTRLLDCYQEEAPRTVVRVQGRLVEESLREEILVALRAWAAEAVGGNRERETIHAQNYMILTSPECWAPGSKKSRRAKGKLEANKHIWDLAQKAMASVDPVFATTYTSVAMTHGFQGSPHIDRQNIGPFYGLALGDFEEGTGGIMVECSARVVAQVNTKNRLGKVDGRYPHWVDQYDVDKERFSLIFYKTTGDFEKVGPAVFEVPDVS